MWQEELLQVYLAGPNCFMAAPDKVAALLDWERYHAAWSWESPNGELRGIPREELMASAVELRIGTSDTRRLVLLHKRRVSSDQAETSAMTATAPFARGALGYASTL